MAEIEQSIVQEVEEEVKPKTWKDTLWSFTKALLKIVITGALLYYVFSKIPFAKVKTRFGTADYRWMVAGVFFYFISMVASAWRLLSFFKAIHLRLNTRFNFRLYMLGIFYNFLLPGGIGGDGYKIWLLNKRYNVPAKKALSAILFDRLSGLWAIGLLVVLLKIFIPQIAISFAIPLGIFLFGTLVYYIVIKKFFPDFANIHFIKGHGKAILVQSLQLITVIMVLFGQDFHDKFSPYLLSFLLSALAAIVPTIGGAGARELIFQKLSPIFHLDVGLALFISISFLLISLVVALGGIYYLLRPSRLEEGMTKDDKPTIESEPAAE
jgi:glycosyltransferase 2 family protein